MKVCRHCGEQKPTGEFPANRRCHDGLSPWCRLCHNEASDRSRAKRAEREAPIIEAKRKEEHAKWMAEWRANLRRRQKQIARNRKALASSEAADGG
jgi:hypothetical protein